MASDLEESTNRTLDLLDEVEDLRLQVYKARALLRQTVGPLALLGVPTAGRLADEIEAWLRVAEPTCACDGCEEEARAGWAGEVGPCRCRVCFESGCIPGSGECSHSEPEVTP